MQDHDCFSSVVAFLLMIGIQFSFMLILADVYMASYINSAYLTHAIISVLIVRKSAWLFLFEPIYFISEVALEQCST